MATITGEDEQLAKPNFQFEKRQKELEKKRKNEEKLRRKLEKKAGLPTSVESGTDADQTADDSALPPNAPSSGQ